MISSECLQTVLWRCNCLLYLPLSASWPVTLALGQEGGRADTGGGAQRLLLYSAAPLTLSLHSTTIQNTHPAPRLFPRHRAEGRDGNTPSLWRPHRQRGQDVRAQIAVVEPRASVCPGTENRNYNTGIAGGGN